jgi:hypothetical protein
MIYVIPDLNHASQILDDASILFVWFACARAIYVPSIYAFFKGLFCFIVFDTFSY